VQRIAYSWTQAIQDFVIIKEDFIRQKERKKSMIQNLMIPSVGAAKAPIRRGYVA